MTALETLARQLRDHADELASDIPLSRDRDAHMRQARYANTASRLASQLTALSQAPDKFTSPASSAGDGLGDPAGHREAD